LLFKEPATICLAGKVFWHVSCIIVWKVGSLARWSFPQKRESGTVTSALIAGTYGEKKRTGILSN
jgi:hypothetical protein